MTDQPDTAIEIEEKSASTLELFFDLVFVFAITQVVSLVAHDLTWNGLFHGTVILGILWWGWTNWVWATNLVSLEPRIRKMIVLLAMFGLFIMAHAVPTSFEGDGLWLAVPYLIVSALSSALLLLDARARGLDLSGLGRYAPIMLSGGVLFVVGAFFETNQQWWWLASLAVTIGAATFGGGSDWAIDAKHFAERHGLILIIALGEAIIAVGASLAGTAPSGEIAFHLSIGLALAMTLYWAYFDRAQEIWEQALRREAANKTGQFARDVYTFTHFPMIVGIVLIAVALEEAFHRPNDPLESFTRSIFMIGLACFFLGIAAAAFRAHRRVLWERVIGVAGVAIVIGGATAWQARTTVIVVTGLLIVSMVVEYVRHRFVGPPRPDALAAQASERHPATEPERLPANRKD